MDEQTWRNDLKKRDRKGDFWKLFNLSNCFSNSIFVACNICYNAWETTFVWHAAVVVTHKQSGKFSMEQGRVIGIYYINKMS